MGAEPAELRFERTHVGSARCADVYHCAGALGDDVGARAAFDDVGVDGDAAAGLVKPGDARDLQRQFVHRVDAILRIDPGVRGAAGYDQLDFADAFARRLQPAIGPAGGFEHQHSIAASGLFLDHSARRFTANLFIRGPQKDQALGWPHSHCAERSCGKQGDHQAAFHVVAAGAIGAAPRDAEGHAGKCAEVVDSVEMAQDQDLPRWPSAPGPQLRANMVTAPALEQKPDARAAIAPLGGHDPPEPVNRCFVEAGRFCAHEAAQQPQHFLLLEAQVLEKALGQIK